MTNPDNAVGTNGAFGGRTSVNAFNDIMGAFTKGIVSGWVCSPSSGMTVALGGDGSVRDVAIAEDNAGNKTSINNISQSPIEVTLSAAPATGSRIDQIVAYVENPPQGDAAQVDNFAAVGLITVSGAAASSPSAPTDGMIRNAITADGATGSTAYYVVLASIRVGTNVTTIGSGVITQGAAAQSQAELADDSVTADKIDWTTFTHSATEKAVGKWIDGKTIYRKTWTGTYTAVAQTVNQLFTASGVSAVIKAEGYVQGRDAYVPFGQVHRAANDVALDSFIIQTGTSLTARVYTLSAGSSLSYAVTVYYTKS